MSAGDSSGEGAADADFAGSSTHDEQPMSERRVDVLTGRQVLIASVRALRPHAVSADPPLSRADDPFAEGQEHETPSERFALRQPESLPNSSGWRVRVVPNRFPAVTESTAVPSGITDIAVSNNSTTSTKSGDAAADGPFTAAAHQASMLPVSAAFGQHDVVIECAEAVTRMVQLSAADIAEVLLAWQLRIRQLSQRNDVAHVSVFRNEGFSAGASLAHCHSQIIAVSSVPPLIAERQRRAVDYRQRSGRDLVEDWLRAELDQRHRIVCRSAWTTALCPFASRTAWNVRLLPHDQERFHFDRLSADDLQQLAIELRRVLRALNSVLDQHAFNLTLTLPGLQQPDSFRWLLDILPRTGRIAGWELMTDIDILSTSPETAARLLRKHLEPPDRHVDLRSNEKTSFQWRFPDGEAGCQPCL